ncbi:toprim domain-containing protein [Alkaliphilus metalliredigens]|uniref:toprim domain-containing protein n=1 Tax=Alkaliphilus metalliredigens TaxID=208226 RepID=UPI00005CABC8|nr:toprim domain-containing protein [Alkaliphilus metalliredigens]
MKLVIAEKPSVARAIAGVLGANEKKDGYLTGNGYIVSWCIGHLVSLATPEEYDPKYLSWQYEDLPIMPLTWHFSINKKTEKQYRILEKLIK